MRDWGNGHDLPCYGAGSSHTGLIPKLKKKKVLQIKTLMLSLLVVFHQLLGQKR